MIWLTWRQFRVSAVVAAAALLATAILLGITHPSGGGYVSHDHLLKFLSTFLVGVPALIGAFWGAPLVAGELESGTYRLVWTQSVTRERWLAVKFGIIALAAVLVTGLLSLMLTAWSSDAVNQARFSGAMFAERGIAPMGYAVLGFAVGVTAGILIRRTLPAMATTLVAFLATRLVVQNWVRPHFAAPLKLSAVLSAENGDPVQAKPGAWVISNRIIGATGHAINNISCGARSPANGVPGDVQSCMAQYHAVLTYQPASRYWTFQSYETAIFAAGGLLLIAFCFWWTRHRLS